MWGLSLALLFPMCMKLVEFSIRSCKLEGLGSQSPHRFDSHTSNQGAADVDGKGNDRDCERDGGNGNERDAIDANDHRAKTATTLGRQ